MGATEKISSAFENLAKSFDTSQKHRLNKDGFTFIEKFQAEKVYKDEGKQPKKPTYGSRTFIK